MPAIPLRTGSVAIDFYNRTPHLREAEGDKYNVDFYQFSGLVRARPHGFAR